MATSDTGGEVNFPAQNERMQFQNKHRFRLRQPVSKVAMSHNFSLLALTAFSRS
jgi:hypothetical protein